MNPCIDCSLDNQGCHESGFANERCEAWRVWKTQFVIWRGDIRREAREKARIAAVRDPAQQKEVLW